MHKSSELVVVLVLAMFPEYVKWAELSIRGDRHINTNEGR